MLPDYSLWVIKIESNELYGSQGGWLPTPLYCLLTIFIQYRDFGALSPYKIIGSMFLLYINFMLICYYYNKW